MTNRQLRRYRGRQNNLHIETKNGKRRFYLVDERGRHEMSADAAAIWALDQIPPELNEYIGWVASPSRSASCSNS